MSNPDGVNALRNYDEINRITVDGRTLYNNNFVIDSGNAATDYVEYDRPETFENRELTAGMGLQFETRLYDGVFGDNTDNPNHGKLHVTTIGNFGTVIPDTTPPTPPNRDALIENAIKDNPGTGENEEI